eukprot:3792481-Prymnesium_polylepis.1
MNECVRAFVRSYLSGLRGRTGGGAEARAPVRSEICPCSRKLASARACARETGCKGDTRVKAETPGQEGRPPSR